MLLQLDNDHKIVWAGQHMLNDNPRRRFAFGITVEDGDMKLWIFSRSRVMISEPFDWRQNASTLIRVFGCLAFVASDAELGYDSTMTRFLDLDTGKTHYKMQVGEKVYVTKKALSDRKLGPIRGPATRVWEAYLEGDESKTSVALKDVWVDCDSELEGDLQKRLIDYLKQLPKYPPYEDGEDDEERRKITQHRYYPKQAYGIENPTQYFLTVITHALVKINGVVDATKEVMMRGQEFPSEKGYRSKHFERFQPMKHYRIVFAEVGTPIHELTSCHDIFKALSDITRAIHGLFLLGYVHRDISPANILWHNGVGKLCDFEFAKHITADSSHEAKTGTPDFIAVEIQDQEYHFIVDNNGIDAFVSLDDEQAEHPVLRYNTLHDLESTWWIAVWMLFFKTSLGDISLPSVHDQNRDECFPPDLYSYGHRKDILTDGFEDGLEYLPESLRFLGALLEKGRKILVIHYHKAEKKRPIAVARWWRVHELMGSVFDQIVEKCGDFDTLWAAESAKKCSPDLVDVNPDPPRKRHDPGNIAISSLRKPVRSQFFTKTSSQESGKRVPPGTSAGPAYRTRSHQATNEGSNAVE